MSDTPRRSIGSEVLLEEIRSEVRRVAEGHSTLVRGQQGVHAELVQLTSRFGQVEAAVIRGVQDLRRSVDMLRVRFDAHENVHT